MIENSKDCFNCGSVHKSKPFCIYDNGYHCFSCGVSKRGDRSFSQKQELVNKTKTEILGEEQRDYSKFSLLTKAWLSKYYITAEHVQNNNMFEINELGKIWLVMPNVNYEGEIVFYQKRLMNERGFVSSGPKQQAFNQYHFINESGPHSCVIVEDFISYCRVGTLVDCVCLFGTSMNNEEAKYITRYYDNIYVWLDNDHDRENNPGQKAAKKICKTLEYTLYLNSIDRGFSARKIHIENIATDMDPKCYSDTEIKQILGR